MDRGRGQARPAGGVPDRSAQAPAKRAAERRRARRSNDFVKPNDIVRVRGTVDRPMLIIIMLLICFGSVMVFSASFAYALSKYGDSYYYIKKQLIFVTLGLGAMLVMILFDYRWLKKITVPFFLGATLLLSIVPFYGISQGVATRWIYIGSIRLQPSEIMKLALILFLALYVDAFQDRITDYADFKKSSIWGVFIPVGVVGFICVLIALENHFSGMIIMFMIGMVVIFAGGARKFWFIVTGAMAAALILCGIFFTDYATARIDQWLNPENYSEVGEIWQTLQGLYAVGSGGLFGVGLGYSQQKHMFVSQPQNDFIFAIICEELGFIGAMMVVTLFVLFIWRGFVIALRAPDTFSSLVVVGITGKVAIQAILNIAVVTNLIPNTGISLPFFSYGGSALAMLLGEMGILLSISKYSYQRK